MIRKNHNHKLQTKPWHREESLDTKKTKEWTHSKTLQNIEQLQIPTIGVTNNNNNNNKQQATILEQTAAQVTCGLNAFYRYSP